MAKNKNHGSAGENHHDDHRPNVKLYIGVFAALMVLTCVTVIISKFHLPRPQAIALGLLVAAIKASLVGAIFMHLWGEKKMIHTFLYVTVACGAIMIIPIIDFVLTAPRVMNHPDVAAQHPDEGAGHEEHVTESVKLAPEAAAPAKPVKAKGKKK
jgi:cytochrome c oxidase subunit 4